MALSSAYTSALVLAANPSKGRTAATGGLGARVIVAVCDAGAKLYDRYVIIVLPNRKLIIKRNKPINDTLKGEFLVIAARLS